LWMRLLQVLKSDRTLTDVDNKTPGDWLNFKNYILKNQIATSSEQFDVMRNFYEDRLSLKNERQKQRDVIEENIEIEHDSILKRIIGEWKKCQVKK